MYEQKEIVLTPFPYTDLTSYKNRPALIISNSNLNKTEDKICCLITSVVTKDGIEIEKKFLKEGKLPFRSWIKPFRIFTINEKIIKKKLCKVSDEFYNLILKEVNKCIK
ncbi:type II toxin-antitoxin system PemK/MazF family toxin [Candidatus Pacearchaeota archaeon]|nr:type II toxin-antitoxin system PemK/MazF family toxin [Candidatus Pacearchaeota archaeon]